MKKFYFSIFTAALLLTSFLSQGQVYNSITTNLANYTLDDPRFWVGGGGPPTNPCNGCTISINSSVTMVQSGGNSSTVTNPYSANVFTSQVPTGLNYNDGFGGITVGMRFQTSIPGNITGARFYKTNNVMAGPHTAVLYDNGGAVLAGPVLFTGETASGWQSVDFGAPVAITTGATYVIAVYMADGFYTTDNGYFATPTVNFPLTAVQDAGAPNGNGSFIYGAPAFPANTFGSSNYWVDVNFSYTTDYPSLNDIVLNGSTVNLYGNTNLNVRTFVQLFNSSIILGNNPSSTEVINLNDQIELNEPSYIQLANDLTSINSNWDGLNPIAGPYATVGGGANEPGIYAVNGAQPGGYTATLQAGGLGSAGAQYLPNIGATVYNYYILNCNPGVPASANTCGDGFVFGPSKTDDNTDPTYATYGILFMGSTTLPVQLVQFLATKNDNGTVNVSWATSQEQNSGYYDVERSGDQAVWATIGTVKAKGFSSTTSNYHFTDQLPLSGIGYYRLKMVDLDGKYTYSKAVAVSSDNSGQALVIYSNPFSDMIRLKVNVSKAQNLIMTVSDIMGKTYISQSYPAQPGDNFVNLQPNAGSSGMYILRIQGDTYDQTVKLEKQ